MAKGRFELKYLVTEELARKIAAYAAPWCEPDRHVKPGERDYTITSLYLDTPGLAFHWAKRKLQFERTKTRVRTYGLLSDGPVFAEIKRRFGDLMVKSRAQIDQERWREVADPNENGDLTTLALSPDGRFTVEDFASQARGLQLRPVVVVRYEREPYVGLFDSGQRVRLTFDRNLRILRARELTLGGDDSKYQSIDYASMFDTAESRVIVEMKFDVEAPQWMQALIYRFDLCRLAFSKYCAGVDMLQDESYLQAPQRLVSVC